MLLWERSPVFSLLAVSDNKCFLLPMCGLVVSTVSTSTERRNQFWGNRTIGGSAIIRVWWGRGEFPSQVHPSLPVSQERTCLTVPIVLSCGLGPLYEKQGPGSTAVMGVRAKPRRAWINHTFGLPWWRFGWESACQCRGHGFEPWSGKIPHADEQLVTWATTTEPARLEPVLRNKRGRDSERPAHHDEEWPPLAATWESPHTETKTQHSHKLIN